MNVIQGFKILPKDLSNNKENKQQLLNKLHVELREFISGKINLLTNVNDRYTCVAECKKAFLLAIQFIENESSSFQNNTNIQGSKDLAAEELFKNLTDKSTELGEKLYILSTGKSINHFDKPMELANLIDKIECELFDTLNLLPRLIKHEIYSYLDFDSLKSLRTVNKPYDARLGNIINKESLIIDIPLDTLSDKFMDMINNVSAYIESGKCTAKSVTLKSFIYPGHFTRLVEALNKASGITSLSIMPINMSSNNEMADMTSPDMVKKYVSDACKLINLTKLEIHGISDDSLTDICASLSLRKSLKELCLFNSVITNSDSLKKLGLIHLTKLEIIGGSLPARYMKIICNDSGLKNTIKILKIILTKTDYASKFSLQDIPYLNMPCLTHLALGAGLNSLELAAICNLSNLRKNLSHLDISRNVNLNNKDSLKILSHLRLTSLKMGYSGYIDNLSNEHLKTVCNTLNLQKTLTYLEIKSSRIKLENVKYLNKLSCLTGLDYRFNGFNNNEELKLFCMIERISNLTELNISLLEFNIETCLILTSLKKLTKLGLGIPQLCAGKDLMDKLKIIFSNIPDINIYIGEATGLELVFDKRILAAFPNLYHDYENFILII